jgi:type IV secretory pathway VirB9-like protein
MQENISTNMTLITNLRSYEFDLQSVNEKSESNIYVARFTYPSVVSAKNKISFDNEQMAPAAQGSRLAAVRRDGGR